MKQININRKAKCQLRHRRITNRLKHDDNKKPRLVVTKTNCHIIAQIVDDQTGKTLVATSTMQIKKPGNIANAKIVGENLAKAAVAKNIQEVVFDRGGHPYHGQIKALAEAARAHGLKF